MSRYESVAIEVNSSALTGLFGADGPESVRERRGGDGGSVVGAVRESGVEWGGGVGLERTPRTTKLACSSSWS